MSEIVVAAGNPLLRRGVVSVLAEVEDLNVVAEVEEAGQVLSTVAMYEPDLLVLETRFRREEENLLEVLAREFPLTGVLVMVDHTFEECVVRHLVSGDDGVCLSEGAAERLDDCCMAALRSHAKGCLPVGSSAPELLTAVSIVLNGQISAGPWIAALLETNGTRNGKSNLPKISTREMEVIELVAKGRSNKGIAKALGLKEQTVKNHLAHVMQKLALDSRVEVALYALKRRIVPLEGQPD